MTAAQARVTRWMVSAAAVVLVCIGFFAHGLHEWVRVLMFISIVGVAAWGNGAQTRVGVREPELAPQAFVADVPAEQTLAD